MANTTTTGTCDQLSGHGCLLRTPEELRTHMIIHGPLFVVTSLLLCLRVWNSRTRPSSAPERMSVVLQLSAFIFSLWGLIAVPGFHCDFLDGFHLRAATLLYATYEFFLLQFFYFKQKQMQRLPAVPSIDRGGAWECITGSPLAQRLYFIATFAAIGIGLFWCFGAVGARIDDSGRCWMTYEEWTPILITALDTPLSIWSVLMFLRPLRKLSKLDPSSTSKALVRRSFVASLLAVLSTAVCFVFYSIASDYSSAYVNTMPLQTFLQLYLAWIDVLLNSICVAVTMSDLQCKQSPLESLSDRMATWRTAFDASTFVVIFDAATEESLDERIALGESGYLGKLPVVEQVLTTALGQLRGIRLSQLTLADFQKRSKGEKKMMSMQELFATDGAIPRGCLTKGHAPGSLPPAIDGRSEACRFGEIDLFISHSWRDNPEAKFRKLTEIVAEFTRRHGREPVLWIDRFCIDQNDLGNSVRYIPVYLLACKKFIALVGPTYLLRSWCCWELFLAFGTSKKRRASSLTSSSASTWFYEHEVHLLDESQRKVILGRFEHFDMRETQAFRLNDSDKMLSIIYRSGGGIDGFNESVRSYKDDIEYAIGKTMSSTTSRPGNLSWRDSEFGDVECSTGFTTRPTGLIVV